MHGKTVILTTHRLDLLNKCDKVAVMRDGTMPYFGDFNAEIIAKEFPGFNSHISDEQPSKRQQTIEEIDRTVRVSLVVKIYTRY